ncbi:MAG TPA: Crp/Fnr family transcriptional regulator [Myxococcaceae bacterium]|nr:Crp/Fnr family transcriptional regulator [Myxococcaceae bacterium]
MFTHPVSQCRSCPVGLAAQGRCPLTPTHVPAGAVLCSQGEHPTATHWLRAGTALLTSSDGAGAERAVSLRGPRSLLALEAMRGATSPVEIRALTDLDLCSARGDALADWAGPAGTPARAMVDLLLQELGARQVDLELSRGSALSRVARLCAALAAASPPVPKQVAARALGLRPETFSRCLGRLAQRGLLAPGPRIRVLNEGGLAEIAAGFEDEACRAADPA